MAQGMMSVADVLDILHNNRISVLIYLILPWWQLTPYTDLAQTGLHEIFALGISLHKQSIQRPIAGAAQAAALLGMLARCTFSPVVFNHSLTLAPGFPRHRQE